MFTVVLTPPSRRADVNIGVSSSDTGEGTVSTDMLTFTDHHLEQRPNGDGDGGWMMVQRTAPRHT